MRDAVSVPYVVMVSRRSANASPAFAPVFRGWVFKLKARRPMPQAGDEFKYDQTRVVSWVDPGRVRRMMDGLTGLEVNEAIRDGRLPEPTLSRVLGIRCVAVSEGEVSAELMPREDLENMGGTIHGGVLAALLDTVMGAALHTRLSAGQKFATIDLKVNYLSPLSRASGVMRGTGRVINAGRRIAYVEGKIRTSSAALAVHAVGNFALLIPPGDAGSVADPSGDDDEGLSFVAGC
jgi:uncharacterized protein (TIGR00369 family)